MHGPRRRLLGRRLGVVATLAAGLLLIGCGASGANSTARGASSSVTLTLYNGQHEQTTDTIVSAFEKTSGINVQIRNNDENTFDEQIVAEGARSPADVFLAENSPALEYLQQKGLLAKVGSSTLAAVPSRYNSPSGNWVGVSARVSVIVYNPSLIKRSALPTQVLQLADSRYAGKVAIAPGETDFQPIVTAVLNRYGQAKTISWLEGVKRNAGSRVYPDNETVTNDVNRGQVAFGIINQYYWYRLRAEIGASGMHSAIAYLQSGDPGYVVDVSGAAVLKSSHHQQAAQRFLAFLVSKQAQEIIGDPARSISFEYPIADGVTTKAPETPLKDLHPYPITIAELGTGSQAIALMREVQLL